MYFIAIRLQLLLEFILLLLYFQYNFQNNAAKKIFKILGPLFFIFTVYDYIKTSKVTFGADQAIVESLFMLIILIYFFFEKIKYDIKVPLYEYKIFWVAVAFFIFFSGNFFLLIYSKTMINDLNFRQQYIFVYSSFNIIKNVILSIALILKEDKDIINNTESLMDDSYFFNHPNQQ